MNFLDDSHILSKLGILESQEKSPKKDGLFADRPTREERHDFVNIKLNPDVSESESDDLVFDRNNLLSTRRQNAALIRGSSDNQAIRFILLGLLFFTSGLISAPIALSSCSATPQFISCLWICLGSLLGAYFLRFFAFRSNMMLLLFALVLFLTANSYLPLNLAIVFATRGMFIGAVLYGGILCWFALWRSQPRRLLALIFLFSVGGMVSMLSANNVLQEATTSVADLASVSRTIQENFGLRQKRDSDVTNRVNELLPFQITTPSENSTDIVKSEESEDDGKAKKPEVATGSVTKSKTKTEENAEKEQEVKEKQKEDTMKKENSTEVFTTTEPVTDASTSSSSTTTTTPEASTTTTTEAPKTTKTPTNAAPRIPIAVQQPENIHTRASSESEPSETTTSTGNVCPSDSLFLTGADQTSFATSSVVYMFCVLVAVLYFFSYLLCCLPCGAKADSRIKKLEGASTVGLNMRLRIAIAAIQTMVGFSQQLAHFHPLLVKDNSSASSQHMTGCVVSVLASAFLMILGSGSASLSVVWISFILHFIGEIFTVLSPSSTVAAALNVFGLHTLWISIFLTTENFLQARATVQLAYFLIASVVGRALACLFALENVSTLFASSFSLLLTIATGVILFYASRHLIKARRLKEILDNSCAPIPSGSGTKTSGGEYISLTERDISDDEDDLLDDDGIDRNSMDLDYELEQMGLEPVGRG